jgi:protoporphyrinogen oxidase
MAGTYGLRPGNDALPTAMARRLDVVHARAEHIELKDGRVHAVHIDRDGVKERLATSCVISALRAPDAQEILSDAPETAEELGALTYSSVVLANLHLDRPIPGPDWVYVFSRVAGHGAAFACDLTRRSPTMFEDEKAVLQLNFAAPVSDRLLRCSDAEIVEAALSDMQAFLPDVADWVERTSVVRRPRVLPNFPVGTFTLVERIKRLASSISGLHLAGDYLRSPLCEGAVRSAHQAVSQMV